MSVEPRTPLFNDPAPAQGPSKRLVLLACVAVAIVVGSLVAIHLHQGGPAPVRTVAPLDAYAPSLTFENITLSEAGHGTGTKSIYVDGQLKNNGSRTLSALTVQAIFHAADGSNAALETLPLALVRSREPYVDLQPISAAPVAPGASADFRLIFEGIPDAWDQQPPQIRAIHAVTK
ncbi:DUF2393 family protein [Terriglobus saanensis]|uniref:DUF2393 domain-containing protein n=1 Tax=Terriglobus saanensis (strain ATCC BAA-1853 / DSM 23119 / SP1PR4) TaxID=401053 RepID=E8V8M3_TERSS|nr:DUF2393 family protein [Terriglobus saanensis]ADV84060.1 hypothetical protein AciPR4_3306 [Terriglobus saanensis SP1PR4]